MHQPSMWSTISSQDFPYPTRSRCSNTYQAPYWKTFTAADTVLEDKSTFPGSAVHRVIRSDSVASVNRVSCSVSPLQSLPFPTRVKDNNLLSFMNTHEVTPVAVTSSKSHQLLGLKSLYRNPQLMPSLTKSPTQYYQSPTPSRLSVTPNGHTPISCTPPSSLYIDIQQLVAPSQGTLPDLYRIDDSRRKIRFVRSAVNTPLYELQLRQEVHSPSLEMKRQMSSLKVQGHNRSVYGNSKKFTKRK